MNDLLRVVLDHHLYIFVPAVIAIWWWGRESKEARRARELRRPRAKRATRWELAWHTLLHRVAGPVTPPGRLQAEAANLDAQRRRLEQQIAELEAEPRQPPSGRAQQLAKGRRRRKR